MLLDLLAVMAADNMAETEPSLEILNRFCGLRPTGNRSSFEPHTEELLHLCPLSRSSGRRVVRLPELNREQ